jgi:hypothetical protein
MAAFQSTLLQAGKVAQCTPAAASPVRTRDATAAQLQSLNLSWNDIRDEGALALAAALKG